MCVQCGRFLQAETLRALISEGVAICGLTCCAGFVPINEICDGLDVCLLKVFVKNAKASS